MPVIDLKYCVYSGKFEIWRCNSIIKNIYDIIIKPSGDKNTAPHNCEKPRYTPLHVAEKEMVRSMGDLKFSYIVYKAVS